VYKRAPNNERKRKSNLRRRGSASSRGSSTDSSDSLRSSYSSAGSPMASPRYPSNSHSTSRSSKPSPMGQPIPLPSPGVPSAPVPMPPAQASYVSSAFADYAASYPSTSTTSWRCYPPPTNPTPSPSFPSSPYGNRSAATASSFYLGASQASVVQQTDGPGYRPEHPLLRQGLDPLPARMASPRPSRVSTLQNDSYARTPQQESPDVQHRVLAMAHPHHQQQYAQPDTPPPDQQAFSAPQPARPFGLPSPNFLSGGNGFQTPLYQHSPSYASLEPARYALHQPVDGYSASCPAAVSTAPLHWDAQHTAHYYERMG
jgi:hypothetical protein